MAFGAVLAPGVLLGAPRGLLGGSWGVLGGSWGLLGVSWGLLGGLWAASVAEQAVVAQATAVECFGSSTP